MPDCDSVPIQTVRVYLKRLPSGAYRATVLTPSLPRPLFRVYPSELGEVEAVARAVGRALSLSSAEQGDQKDCDANPGIHELVLRPVDDDCQQTCGDEDKTDSASCRYVFLPPPSDEEPAENKLCPFIDSDQGQQPTQHRRPPVRVRVTWQGLL